METRQVMKVGTNGLVVNELGQVLLIRRDDIRTWVMPGGALDAGELPTAGCAREVEEETGLKVLPVRLVGLYFWAERPHDYLIFVFRCLVRGGTLTPSEESPQLGFFPIHGLPSPMMAMPRERLERGFVHDGGPPYWGRQPVSAGRRLVFSLLTRVIYRSRDVRRWWRGQPRFQPAPAWQVGAFVVVRDAAGRALWVKRTDYDVWNLPGGAREAGEAPWEAAAREAREETGLDVRLTDLTGVYVKPAKNEMVFAFTGEVTGGALTTGPEAAGFEYFAPGEEPANTLPKHLERAADAGREAAQTVFKVQAGPPGLAVLGLR